MGKDARSAGDPASAGGSSLPVVTGKPAEPKDFEFVLVTDSESRRQVRRHAMRQYMRQRRLEGIARLESSRVPVGGWTASRADNSASAPSRAEEPREDNAGNKDVSNGSAANARLSVASNANFDLNQRNIAYPLQVTGNNTSDPRATPGTGGMRDPFNSYPIAIKNQADHELVNHFVITYPSMMYKFLGSIHGNPMMEIFRQFALRDPLSFQAMLAIASKHRAGVEGQSESVLSLTHKMRTLRLINERIQSDDGRKDDGTIYAAASMSVIEKWSKDASVERTHYKGLASLIRNRGGMRGMRATNRFLESILYWVDFSCAPKAIVSASLPWTGAVPDVLPETLDFLSPDLHLTVPYSPTEAEHTEGLSDYLRACEDFLSFFRCLHALERTRLREPFSVPSGAASGRRNLFDHSTPLHSIVTTLPDYDHGIRDIRFIDEYTCMACLLYMNIALYDCYVKSLAFDRYLEWLDTEIRRINPYSHPSITSLLWLFLRNGGYPNGHVSDEGERNWIVSRMLRVVKRSEWKHRGSLWDRVRRALIGFVSTQQECGLGSDRLGRAELLARHRRLGQQDEYLWDEDEIRREILGDLYSRAPIYATVPPPQMNVSGYVQSPSPGAMSYPESWR